VPPACLRDAHQIYALAESEGLFDLGQGQLDTRLPMVETATDAYATLLTLATLDLRQIRARQLSLAMEFLRDHREKIKVTKQAPEYTWRETDRVLNFTSCFHPVHAASYLGNFDDPHTRWLDLAPLLRAVDDRSARTRTTLSMTLGNDTLERQTLTRLNHALTSSRSRKIARCVSHNVVQISFGHQQIANQLLLGVSDVEGESVKPVDSPTWIRFNYSAQGAAYRCEDALIGTIQVGELVAVETDNNSTLIGAIRWVHAADNGALAIGVEFLSNGVVPVALSRANADEGVTDEALIIACRLNGKVTQTILLP